jgi:NADH-quinone oxidoreductase subunit G
VARLVFDTYNLNRPIGPNILHRDKGFGPTEWDRAYDGAAYLLKHFKGNEMFFLGSPYATVEDNYLLKKLALALGAPVPQFAPDVEPGTGDDWLITDDQAPNAQGCRRLGFEEVDFELLRTRLREGSIKLLYILEDDPLRGGLLEEADLDGVQVIVHHYHADDQVLNSANVALPAAMNVETIGTYVNEDGRAQRLRPAKAIQGVSRALMMEMGMSRQDRQGTPFDRWYKEENKVDCRPSWVILPEIASRLGIDLAYDGPAAIMAELAQTDPFRGATHEAMAYHGFPLVEDLATAGAEAEAAG